MGNHQSIHWLVAMPLPSLREELELQESSRLTDGQPTWTLHDPVRNLFFQIDWSTFEILVRWSLDDPALIAASVNTSTTLSLEPSSVESVAKFLTENQLVRAVDVAESFESRLRLSRGSLLHWILHNYLFFRVPLFKPDTWLTRMLPWVRPFFSRAFFISSAVALVAGLVLAYKQYDRFVATLIDTVSMEGVLAYALALFSVKVLHELGHAFMAKRLGCRVPTMGVAFLVLWPMAYTDTNDTWRLKNPIDRLRVASAGISTELIVAIWATLFWSLLPEGPVKGAAFFLATTSWTATLIVNASPFMRFDGYFIVCDFLNMPNLHARSFALARWKLREWLFDLRQPKPEYFSKGKELSLIAFAFVTWLYRFIVFLGIAVLVYHFFVKVVGILLFLVEILWFIALPIWRELKEWSKFWPILRQQPVSKRRVVMTVVAVASVCSLLVIPIPGRVGSLGILRPATVWPLYAAAGSKIDMMPVAEGQSVESGQRLLELSSIHVHNKLELIKARIANMEWVASSSGLDDVFRQKMLVNKEELATLRKEKRAVSEELSKFDLVSPFSGLVVDLDPDYAVGQWVAGKEKLAMVLSPGSMVVETYVDEEAVRRIKTGDHATFVTEGLEGPRLALRVEQVDADASRHLTLAMLSSQAGGHISSREKNGQLIPEQAVYRVLLNVESDPGSLKDRVWRGQLVIHCQSQTIAERYLRHALMVLAREAGF